MKRRHTSIDLTWSNLHFHTQAHASGLQTGDQASRCKYSWNILICSQLTTSNLKRCPFSGIRLSIRGLQCTCFFLPKYCPGGTKIFQYFTWRVFKSIFSRRIVQSALQVGSYEGNHGNQTATKCCKSTSTDTLDSWPMLSCTSWTRHDIKDTRLQTLYLRRGLGGKIICP